MLDKRALDDYITGHYGEDQFKYDRDFCYVCGEPFTDDEWEDRHTDPETGEDCHAGCCSKCNGEKEA